MKRFFPKESILDKDVFARPEPRRRKPGLRPGLASWVLIAWVVLLAVWAVKVYVEQPYRRFAPENASGQSAGPLTVKVVATGPAAVGGVDLTAVELGSLTQSMLDNEALGGQLWVLSGEAVNRGVFPVENIRLRLAVRNPNGEAAEEITWPAGASVPLFQLKSLPLEEIRALLGNKVQILAVNRNVRPGDALPFMFVLPQEAVAQIAALHQYLEISVDRVESQVAPGSCCTIKNQGQ